MRKILNTLCALSIASLIIGCGKDYVANADNNGNQSSNPLNLLSAKDFTWGGEKPLSADIDGVHYVADPAYTSFALSSGNNLVVSMKNGQGFVMNLGDVWGGNVYNINSMRMPQEYRSINYYDSAGDPRIYYCDRGLVGQVYITQNDTDVVEGKFYLQAANKDTTKIIAITKGYFYITK